MLITKKAITNLLVIFCLSTLFVHSQNYLIHNYTYYDGLPSSIIYDIDQDKDGVMWFVTRGGIVEYDGFEWKLHPDTHKIKEMRYVKNANNGTVWIAGLYLSSGIAVYENKKWKHILITDPVKSVITAFAIANVEGKITVLIGTEKEGLFIYRDSAVQHFEPSHGLSDNHILEIKAFKSNFYILTKKGLGRYSNDRYESYVIPENIFPKSNIKAFNISQDPDDITTPIIWLHANKWIGYYKSDGTYFYDNFPYPNPNNLIKKQILYDSNNGIYTVNVNGIFYYNLNNKSFIKLTRDNGLLTNFSDVFYKDIENNIWIGSWQGVSKIVSQRFATYRKKHGLLRDEVTAFVEYQKGKYVFGHDNGITFYNGKKYHKYENIMGRNKLSSLLNRTVDLCADKRGNIWAAVNNWGILKIDKTRNFKWYFLKGKDDFVSVMCDKNGDLWTSKGQQIFKLKNDNFEELPFKLPEKTVIRKLFSDGFGGLLIATPTKGVIRSDGCSNKFFMSSKSSANNVYAIYSRKDKHVLVGTGDGLYKIEDDSLKKYKDGFEISHPVYFIIKDNKNNYWFGTNKGVYRWNGEILKHFTHVLGLSGVETNRSAGYVDSNGNVWIGTDFGISKYDESKEHKSIAPKLEIKKITGGKTNLFNLDNNTFSADQNNITINFRCISFVDEKNISVEYKLEGIDKDWRIQKPLLKPEIIYSNLPPGEYRFKIRAQNVEGIKSYIIESPIFYISLPFYRQLWFYIFVAILATSFIFLIYLHKIGKKQAKKLEILVEERTTELYKTEKKLREFFEQSKDVIFICTAKWKFIEINPAGVELFGYVLKKELFEISLIPDLLKKTERGNELSARLKKDGYLNNIDIIINTKQNNDLHMILSANAIFDSSGEMNEIRGILKDITDKQQLTKQLNHAKRMESVGVLAGGIAHDFNNILSVILGFSELAIDDIPEDSIHHKNFKSVIKAALRAKGLVEQILTFSRQKEHKIQHVKVDLIVKEALKFLRPSLPSTIELNEKIEKEAPVVLADPSQIHQIVMNLCTNAYQVIGENNGIIDIQLNSIVLDEKNLLNLTEGLYIKLIIKDTGHGIDSEHLERIFDPFFTTKSVGQGTGLGLAVVHGIVNSLNGAINVISNEGEGTIFTVYLPAIEEPEIEKPKKADSVQGGVERVLLVDDDHSVADMSKQMLEKLGYMVSIKYDSTEAFNTFLKDSQYFDLVLSDQVMPNMSGMDLAEEILKIRPDMPIILMTGFSEKINPEEIYKMGIRGYIAKPITKKDLADLIRNIL